MNRTTSNTADLSPASVQANFARHYRGDAVSDGPAPEYDLPEFDSDEPDATPPRPRPPTAADADAARDLTAAEFAASADAAIPGVVVSGTTTWSVGIGADPTRHSAFVIVPGGPLAKVNGETLRELLAETLRVGRRRQDQEVR